MSLKEEDRRILVQLELEKADKTLSQVAVLQREGYWDTNQLVIKFLKYLRQSLSIIK